MMVAAFFGEASSACSNSLETVTARPLTAHQVLFRRARLPVKQILGGHPLGCGRLGACTRNFIKERSTARRYARNRHRLLGDFARELRRQAHQSEIAPKLAEDTRQFALIASQLTAQRLVATRLALRRVTRPGSRLNHRGGEAAMQSNLLADAVQERAAR